MICLTKLKSFGKLWFLRRSLQLNKIDLQAKADLRTLPAGVTAEGVWRCVMTEVVSVDLKRLHQSMLSRLNRFAEVCHLNVQTLANGLYPLFLDQIYQDDAVNYLTQESAPFGDLCGALVDTKVVPKAVLRKNLGMLYGADEKEAEVVEDVQVEDMLGDVAFDDDTVVGVLKRDTELRDLIEPNDVVYAVSVALANRTGFFSIPTVLHKMMLDHQMKIDSPSKPAFYALERQIRRRQYRHILDAITKDGSFVDDARKAVFYERVDKFLWRTLHNVAVQIQKWFESSDVFRQQRFYDAIEVGMQKVVNPNSVATASLVSFASPVDAGMVRDAVDVAHQSFNKMFAGPILPVPRELMAESVDVKNLLKNKELPLMVGATTDDELKLMLVERGLLDVTSEHERMELKLKQFAAAVMLLRNRDKFPPNSQMETRMLMFMLYTAMDIPWRSLQSDLTDIRPRTAQSNLLGGGVSGPALNPSNDQPALPSGRVGTARLRLNSRRDD